MKIVIYLLCSLWGIAHICLGSWFLSSAIKDFKNGKYYIGSTRIYWALFYAILLIYWMIKGLITL